MIFKTIFGLCFALSYAHFLHKKHKLKTRALKNRKYKRTLKLPKQYVLGSVIAGLSKYYLCGFHAIQFYFDTGYVINLFPVFDSGKLILLLSI